MTHTILDMKKYVKKRDKLLRKLDIKSMKKFYQEHNPPEHWPSKDEVYLIMMHKARMHLTTFTNAEKAVSKQWLDEHGYTTAVMGLEAEPIKQ